jgi:hypothetical protein
MDEFSDAYYEQLDSINYGHFMDEWFDGCGDGDGYEPRGEWDEDEAEDDWDDDEDGE